jgi:hypothetical protein
MITNFLFDARFPLLSSIIIDEQTRKSLNSNKYLIRKYQCHEEIIAVFIKEINNRFDKETIYEYVNEVVIRYPDELMVSFITAYLNSSEHIKSDIDVINYYKKTLKQGNETIHYVERHGIINSFELKEIPENIIEERYKSLKTGLESYKGIELNTLYTGLNIDEKEYVNKILEKKSFSLLEVLFNDNKSSFKTLINILMKSKIDTDILNTEVINSMQSIKHFLYLTYMLYELEDPSVAVNNIKKIISGNKYDLLIELINEDLISSLNQITIEDINVIEKDDLIKYLKSLNVLSKIREEYKAA